MVQKNAHAESAHVVCMCVAWTDLWLCSTLTSLENDFYAYLCKGETVCTCVSEILCVWKDKVVEDELRSPLSMQM